MASYHIPRRFIVEELPREAADLWPIYRAYPEDNFAPRCVGHMPYNPRTEINIKFVQPPFINVQRHDDLTFEGYPAKRFLVLQYDKQPWNGRTIIQLDGVSYSGVA